MRRDNPKLLKARVEREKAELWLDVLCKGIGQRLAGYDRYAQEDLDLIVGLVNGELTEALTAAKIAEENYRPFWSRLRRRRVIVRTPKKNLKAATK